MRRTLALVLVIALASCATVEPSSSAWAKIEGCWREDTDHWPGSMRWERDPQHPGGYVGRWSRQAAQGDTDEFQFRLAPAGDRMQLCQRRLGGDETCETAVFGRGGWRRDGVAVMDVVGDYHEFGYAGATAAVLPGAPVRIARECETPHNLSLPRPVSSLSAKADPYY